jgi:hypothetical protein
VDRIKRAQVRLETPSSLSQGPAIDGVESDQFEKHLRFPQTCDEINIPLGRSDTAQGTGNLGNHQLAADQAGGCGDESPGMGGLVLASREFDDGGRL